MDALPFAPGKFDLIWAEGALYIMGYRKAARYLHDFLAAEGFLVFSELSWIKPDPPRELVAYWKEEQEVTVHAAGENAAWLDAHGYDVVETFTLLRTPGSWNTTRRWRRGWRCCGCGMPGTGPNRRFWKLS
jgi:SAM-dependent methyltransferase